VDTRSTNARNSPEKIVMNDRVFQRDTITLDASKVEHYDHKTFGPVTVFRDVPIARAIVQEYEDLDR